MNPICQSHGHDWSPTAVYVDGIPRVPCRRPLCEAELRRENGGMRFSPTGFTHAPHGIPLDIEDDPQGGVAKIVMRELAASYDLNDLPLEPGDVVIDIGAHVGIVSIWLAKRYPGIKVYAFEPIAANYRRLQHNIAVNYATGIQAVNLAVSGDGRKLTLAGNPQSNTGGMSAMVSPDSESMGFQVESMSLAQIFDRYDIDRCKLLKIDCEGSEYEILTAGEALLDKVDYLRGEFHINQALWDMGYRIESLLALCARHIEVEHIKVTPCRISD